MCSSHMFQRESKRTQLIDCPFTQYTHRTARSSPTIPFQATCFTELPSIYLIPTPRKETSSMGFTPLRPNDNSHHQDFHEPSLGSGPFPGASCPSFRSKPPAVQLLIRHQCRNSKESLKIGQTAKPRVPKSGLQKPHKS